MSGHVVTHVNTRHGPKFCLVCQRPAVIERFARFYCTDHVPAAPAEPTAEHVRAARQLMKSGNISLSDAATRLGVMSAALDLALWRHLGGV